MAYNTIKLPNASAPRMSQVRIETFLGVDLTNQAIVNYIGDYDYYLEKKEELTEKYAPAAAQAVTEAKQASDNKLSWQQQKEEQARQRKRENELKKVEARIEELETRDKEIDETMVLPDICTNVAECAKLSKEKAAITEELEGLYEKWEETRQYCRASQKTCFFRFCCHGP